MHLHYTRLIQWNNQQHPLQYQLRLWDGLLLLNMGRPNHQPIATNQAERKKENAAANHQHQLINLYTTRCLLYNLLAPATETAAFC